MLTGETKGSSGQQFTDYLIISLSMYKIKLVLMIPNQ